MSFFVSCNSLYFKVYNDVTTPTLISIYVEYLCPSHQFQSVCVPCSMSLVYSMSLVCSMYLVFHDSCSIYLGLVLYPFVGLCQGVCLEVTVSLVQLLAACLSMHGAVLLSCWLFGWRHSSTGACRLLGSDQVLMLNWQPLGEPMLISILWGLCHQCSCPLPLWTTAGPHIPSRSSKTCT